MPNEDGDLGDRRSGFVASVAPMARVAIREGEEFEFPFLGGPAWAVEGSSPHSGSLGAESIRG